MKLLGSKCKKLESLKMTILRTSSFGSVDWNREGPSKDWNGGIIKGSGELPPAPPPVISGKVEMEEQNGAQSGT